jgi:hypothetical protein
LVAIGLLFAVASLGAMEAGVRLVQAYYLNPFQPDPLVGYRLKPNFTGRYPWVPVRTDANGFRVPAEEPPASGRSILFVGDSVTFGFGVLAEDAYPTLFGQRVGRLGDVRNAAVPGYNLTQAIKTIQRFVEQHGKPELIVYGLCLNDISGANATARYEDIDPHAIRSSGLLSSSMLVSVMSRRLARLRAPTPTGPLDSKESLLADFSAPELRAPLAAFDSEWKELEQLQQSLGVPIAVIVLPFRQQIVKHPEWQAPQEYLRAKCASTPLKCLDPWMTFREQPTEAIYTPTSSMHFSPDGSRVLANWLADNLREVLAQQAERRPPA